MNSDRGGARLHALLRLSSLNSAFSADSAPIRPADPVDPIEKVKTRRGRKIHGKGTTSEFVTGSQVEKRQPLRRHQGIRKARGDGGC
jgi:hypothetical protein